KLEAALDAHLARRRGLRAHVELAAVLEHVRKRQVERLSQRDAELDHLRAGHFQHRDMPALCARVELLDEADAPAAARIDEWVGPVAAARQPRSGAAP